MVVWFSSGQPLTAWIRPVIRFAWPIVVAIALLAAFLSPWANYQTAEFRQRLAAKSELSQVSPGVFREVKKGSRVFFVEAMAEDASQVGNVFVASFQEGKLGVVMSNSGHQEVAANGDRFVVLDHGRRYEVEPGTPQFKILDFEHYRVRIEDKEAVPADQTPSRVPITELLGNDTNEARAELLWRIGMPVSALILSLLAIPLSYVNPRAGRSANMLIAILIYAIYTNLMSVSQAWVAQGKLPFWLGASVIHLLMLLPLMILFYHRMAVRLTWPWSRT